MNWIDRRREAYRIVFLQPTRPEPVPVTRWQRLLHLFHVEHAVGIPTPPAELVLADLAWRCHAFDSTTCYGADGHIDTAATLKAEGRREVWLIIQNYLNVDPQPLQNQETPE